MLNNAKECLADEFLIDSRKSNYMMIFDQQVLVYVVYCQIFGKKISDYKACYNTICHILKYEMQLQVRTCILVREYVADQGYGWFVVQLLSKDTDMIYYLLMKKF